MTQRGICDYHNCGKPRMALGLCGGHYKQVRDGRHLRPLRTYNRSRDGGGRAGPGPGYLDLHPEQQGK